MLTHSLQPPSVPFKISIAVCHRVCLFQQPQAEWKGFGQYQGGAIGLPTKPELTDG